MQFASNYRVMITVPLALKARFDLKGKRKRNEINNSNRNTTDCSGTYERCILFRTRTEHSGTHNTEPELEYSSPQGRSRPSRPTVMDVEAAQLDKTANRPIDAKQSHLYLHPPVKSATRDAYRSSFVAGYEAAVKHSSGE